MSKAKPPLPEPPDEDQWPKAFRQDFHMEAIGKRADRSLRAALGRVRTLVLSASIRRIAIALSVVICCMSLGLLAYATTSGLRAIPLWNYVPPAVALIAAILAIRGGTWNRNNTGLARITAIGYISLFLAFIGFGTSILQIHRGDQSISELLVKSQKLEADLEEARNSASTIASHLSLITRSLEWQFQIQDRSDLVVSYKLKQYQSMPPSMWYVRITPIFDKAANSEIKALCNDDPSCGVSMTDRIAFYGVESRAVVRDLARRLEDQIPFPLDNSYISSLRISMEAADLFGADEWPIINHVLSEVVLLSSRA